jgi:hypothetical protein
MKFLIFFLLLWVIFGDLLDPDSEYGSGSTDLIESGSETLPVTEVGVLITAVGVPVTAVGVPVSTSDVSEEAATAAAVVDSVVGVTGKLQNCMIVVYYSSRFGSRPAFIIATLDRRFVLQSLSSNKALGGV